VRGVEREGWAAVRAHDTKKAAASLIGKV
jgi:hypothetical protein